MVLPLWLSIGFAIALLGLVVLVLILAVTLIQGRQSPQLAALGGQMMEIHRRVEEWQRGTARQDQVGEVQRQLVDAAADLRQLQESLRGLIDFTQQTLHRETSDRLARTLTDLTKAQEGLTAVGESLNEYKTSDVQQKEALADQVRTASERLASAHAVLEEIRQSQQGNVGPRIGQALQALGRYTLSKPASSVLDFTFNRKVPWVTEHRRFDLRQVNVLVLPHEVQRLVRRLKLPARRNFRGGHRSETPLSVRI